MGLVEQMTAALPGMHAALGESVTVNGEPVTAIWEQVTEAVSPSLAGQRGVGGMVSGGMARARHVLRVMVSAWPGDKPRTQGTVTVDGLPYRVVSVSEECGEYAVVCEAGQG